MARIIAPPLPRIAQPQGPVGINWANPLTWGLRFAYTPAGGSDAVTGSPPSRVNGPGRAASPRGIEDTFTAASSQYISAGAGSQLALGDEFSILVWYRLATAPTTGNGMSLFARDSDTGGRAYTLDIYDATGSVPNSGVRLYVNGGGSSNLIVEEGRTPVSGDVRLAIVTRSISAGNSNIYINGALAKSVGASGSTQSATTDTRIGSRTYAGFQDYFTGGIALAAAWARALTSAEAAQISRNPWQLFAPVDRQIWVPVAAAAASSTPAPVIASQAVTRSWSW